MRTRGLLVLLVALVAIGGAILAAKEFLETPADDPAATSAGGAGPASAGVDPAGGTGANPESSAPSTTDGDPARAEEFAESSLDVRVVDGSGRPLAGVPVQVGSNTLQRTRSGPIETSRAPDGIARFVDLERRLRALADGKSTKWDVSFPFPHAPAASVPIDPAALPAGGVELVATPLGRLVVTFADAAGAPVAAEGNVEIEAAALADGSGNAASWLLETAEPGRIVVDRIAAGLRLQIEPFLREHLAAAVEADGPRAAGEEIAVVVPILRFGPVVTGRLVGSDGRPRSRASLEASLHDDPDSFSTSFDQSIATGDDGRFRWDASSYELPAEPRALFLDLIERDESTGVAGRARAELPRPFLEGLHDVGDVSFEALPLYVGGVVEDASGAPVAGASVRVCALTISALEFVRAAPAGDVLGATSDASGRFEVHGSIAGDAVVFAFDGSGRECAPRRFAAGAGDVKLVVRGCGAVQGSLAPPRPLDPIPVALFLRHHDAAEDDFALRIVALADGSFSWPRVPEGTIDVGIGIGRSVDRPEIVHTVAGVVVEADAVCADARLQAIDLSESVRRARIEVVDLDGDPVPRGFVTILAPPDAKGTRAPIHSIPLRGVAIEVPTARVTIDVEIRSPGFLTRRIDALVTPARIELEPGVPVRLLLDPPFEPGDGGARVPLSLTLAPVGASGIGPAASQRLKLDGKGSAACFASEIGTFVVDLEIAPDEAVLRRAAATPEAADAAAERASELAARLEQAFGRPQIEILDTDRAREQVVRVPLASEARAVLEEALALFAGTGAGQ